MIDDVIGTGHTYIAGKGNSGLTCGAADVVPPSMWETFPVGPPTLSFFSFFREGPCFPPSTDFVLGKDERQKV